MLSRYPVVDLTHRVIGLGSVGMRAYLALLLGTSDENSLFLQVKEAGVPVHAPYLPSPSAEFSHPGRRIVIGHRAQQASSDVLLGWTTMDKTLFLRSSD
jgi:uncharacterized protein (DUF2252 family)